MEEHDIKIDESTHVRVPTLSERITHAVISLFLGFILVNIVTFWLFPGVGLGGFYIISAAHSYTAFVGELTTVIIYAFLAICGVFGWFRGRYFTDRLKRYIDNWKFW